MQLDQSLTLMRLQVLVMEKVMLESILFLYVQQTTLYTQIMNFKRFLKRLQKVRSQKLLIGTGHGTCTCPGAAFEYIFTLI